MATDRLIQRTLATLRDLRDRALAFEIEHAPEIESLDPHYRNSARNLLHYLSIRQNDIRDLQQDLHSLGLSSLGVLEAHVLAMLNAVISNLEALAGVSRERGSAAAGRLPHRPAAAARPRATPAWPGAPRPLSAHHGHHAERRGRRRPADRGPAAGRHGPDAYQLRARRRDCLAPHGG